MPREMTTATANPPGMPNPALWEGIWELANSEEKTASGGLEAQPCRPLCDDEAEGRGGTETIGTLVEKSTSRPIKYVIDGRNRRVGKLVDGVMVQGFIYENQLRIAGELDGAGAVKAAFVYTGSPNSPDYMVSSGSTFRITKDQVGSPRVVVEVLTGAVAQRVDFDEFGVPMPVAVGLQPIGFAGGMSDELSGLVHFGARDYDAYTGRWLSKDPLRFYGGDANLFGYCLGDPINRVDPSGRFIAELAVALGWTIAVTAAILLEQALAGAGDLLAAYLEMRRESTGPESLQVDKYYHCLGECRAAKRGAGGHAAACALGPVKEAWDDLSKSSGNQGVGGHEGDYAANAAGRAAAASSETCEMSCLMYWSSLM